MCLLSVQIKKKKKTLSKILSLHVCNLDRMLLVELIESEVRVELSMEWVMWVVGSRGLCGTFLGENQ
jgi:hypothetical protein